MIPAIALGIGCVVKLILNLILLPIPELNVYGAAIGSIACHAVAFTIVFNVLRGNHYEDDNIIYLREKWININKIKGKCDGIDVDGEEGPAFPLKIKCIEKGINMLL